MKYREDAEAVTSNRVKKSRSHLSAPPLALREHIAQFLFLPHGNERGFSSLASRKPST